MSNKIREEFEKIDIPLELSIRIEEGINQAALEMNEMQKQHKQTNIQKIVSYAIAAIIFIGLFIGPTISPKLAIIAAKIPYLNKLYHEQDIGTRLFDKLTEKGYSIQTISIRPSDKTITIVILDPMEKFVDRKIEVDKTAKEIVSSSIFKDYKVEVKRYANEEIVESSMQEIFDLRSVVLHVNEKLLVQDYDAHNFSFTFDAASQTIRIEIPNTEGRMIEIKNMINEVLKELGIRDVGVKITQFNLEKNKQYQRWAKIIKIINDGLITNNDYDVKSVSYSNKSIMTFFITVDISAKDSKAKEWAKRIESDVIQVINTNKKKLNIQDDPYKIIIKSSDKVVIN